MTGRAGGMRRQRWTALAAAGLAVALVISLIIANRTTRHSADTDTTGQSAPPTTSDGSGADPDGAGTGPATVHPRHGNPALPAGFSVHAGTASPAGNRTTPVVTGTRLSDAVIARILGRLPAWKGDSGLATDYHWPAQTLIKPTAGKTIPQTFPARTDGQNPPNAPTPPPAGPLTVLRIQPRGDVTVAPFVSITFNQPMVPVSTVGQLADGTVPARISPSVPGHWDWIGTSTLRFSADSDTVDRLPMATRFTVTVPAGTTSTTGGRLASAASATFTTPAPEVQSFTPGPKTPVDLRPVMVAVFNQRVDPATVLRSVTVTADNGARPVRLATAAEIAADQKAAAAVKAAPDGRAVAFVTREDLPAAADIAVTVQAGTRSAEGPRTSSKDADFTIHTRPALSLVRGTCQDWDCRPGQPISLRFSNPLDAGAFDPATVTIKPAIPGGATITAVGSQILISGATRANTAYRVRVKAGLVDTFGQTLAKDASASVRIGHADTEIYQFPTSVTTLDPTAAGRTVTVATVNVTRFRERVLAVDLADWADYRDWYRGLMQRNNYRPGDDLDVPNWPVLVDRTVSVSGSADRTVTTSLDLSGAFAGGRAQVVVLVEPIDPTRDQSWLIRPTTTWVQSSTLTVDAITDQTTMHAWVTDLRTGSPVAGATVVRLDGSGQRIGDGTSTNGDGLARIDLGRSGASALLVSKGGQTALLPGDMWGASWQSSPRTDRLLWYVTDDRQTYRPGETVSVKGWVRRQSGDTAASLTTPGSGTVSWTATDGYGTAIGHGTAPVDRLGGFDLTLDIPPGAHLGGANLHLALDDAAGTSGDNDLGSDHYFTIADYRTPAFEVDTHAETGDPAVRGTDVQVQADATYYAGGPVGDAPVEWQVSTTPASYSPPGWSEYTFGIWTPWWYEDYGATSYADVAAARPGIPVPCCGDGAAQSTVKTFHGTTDGSGLDYLAVQVGDLGKDTDGLPVTVQAQATVTDVNRQQIADTADILVHPAGDYVGLASDSTFIREGDRLSVQTITTDIDGTATAGRPVTVTAARVAGGWSAGQQDETLVDPKTCTVTSKTTPVDCTFTPTVGGQYRITATVTDDRGRTSRSQITRWVAGPDGSVATTVQQQSLTLVPDAKQYRPGQSAHLLVASPISTGTGLITLSHNGIVSSRTFSVAHGSAVVTIPIAAELIPSVTATVEVVGAAPRAGDPAGGSGTRPAYAAGDITLAVSRQSRALTVTATPRDRTVKPGGHTTIDVSVTDRAGKPVQGSQFEVIVVDEAVLALSDYQLPDPLQAFYPDDQSTWIDAVYGRSTVMLGPSPSGGAEGDAAAATAPAAAASGSAASGAEYDTAAGAAIPTARKAPETLGSSHTPIAQRSAFSALALFRPTVTTGADGTAAVPVTLPDNLTRYRVMVVAVAGDTRFGTGESTITAGLPLTVRPTPPRFLNFGDRAELPVLVQNRTDAALTTDVVLQAANLSVAGAGSGATAGATGQRVTVPANGRVEVRFDVAANRAGTARFRVAAVSGDDADAAEQEFPVYTPSTSETFATYGTLDASTDGTGGPAVVAQKITKPTDVIPAFGGLTITTSSTALAQLTDAVDYVTDYDYESADALAAQAMAISSLGDVLQAFSAPGRPTPEQMRAQVAADVTRLIALQNSDGGFTYWRSGERSDPFITVQAVQALLIADRSGYAGNTHGILTKAVGKALPYLRNIDAHLPSDISQQSRDTIDAFALAIRSLAGDGTTADADALVADRGSALPLDAVGWLLPVVSATPRQALLTRVTNAAVDDAGSVTFTESVTDDAWTVLHSDTRTDAVILDALLTVDPHSDLIGKAVNGLMGRQRGGRWATIQDNAFALVALRHYYDSFEATEPDFTAAAWLGNRLAGKHRYVGHTTEQTQVTIPTDEVIKAGDNTITLADNGSGRMYYRIGLTTAPSSLSVDPLDRGFVVGRSYAGADDASDVTRDGKGVWHIKAGARVRVTVTLVSRSAQSHVALTDPLPAGLEPLNPALATTPTEPAGSGDPGAGGAVDSMVWNPTWYDHQDLRDDRAEAFAGYLPGGVYTYSYLALATTPGTFVVPPATAKQIYAPETFGRSGTGHVVVGG